MAITVTVFGKVQLRAGATGNSIRGYTVSVGVSFAVSDLAGPVSERVPIEVPIAASAPVLPDGTFRVEATSEGEPTGKVRVRAASPDGFDSVQRELTLDEILTEVVIEVNGYQRFFITTPDEPVDERLQLRGRVIDTKGAPVAAGLGVVLFGVDLVQGGQPGPPRVVAAGRTQTGGYFSLPWVPDPFDTAFVRLAGGPPITVRLEDAGLLPRRAILVSDAAPAPTNGNGRPIPPRAPDPGDLTENPAAFSQDLGEGCVNLSMPDRTIEEFSYFTVVRTSEPDVTSFSPTERAIVPPLLIGELVTAAATQEALLLRGVQAKHVENLQGLTLDAASAERLLRDDRAPSIQSIARAAWLSEFDRAKDLIGASLGVVATRTEVDQDNPIKWDYDNTIVYQAVSIAHGHIVQFREVWRADGYSLGDLLSSLPLAPGQRRQVAIVDWDRRSQAIREETLEFEEELEASLTRDRDIQEIVGSRLSEEIEAGSRNTTWGVAAGFGAGLISGAFGIFGGVAGGASGSSSKSWQDASRKFSADTMQSLRDRVTQRASSVRDQRATVVQSVAQGETWRAETEVIANYNRCHTVTVEYFQVLRHFVVTHEVANVRECLFVPFPLHKFDGARALRWRETLETFLRDRSLLPAFTSLERVADQWVGWDFPESRYSEEAPESLEGELRVSFVLPRPRDDEDGKYQVEEWRHYSGLIPRDTLEVWVANINAKAARERDEYFRRNVAPEIASNLVAQLRFSYITSSGSKMDLTLDGTLVSRYAEGTPLYVTLRPAGGLPPIPREEIVAFEMRYEGTELPEDARVIVHSGKLRYRTPHLTALLFNEPRLLNDLRAGDPVTVSTPLTREESRNPREEDRERADSLVRHLNGELEFYLQAIWALLDPEFRFTLLDGMLISEAGGLSVASVVENRLIGVAGNSLIFPLAPGIRLDPRIDEESAPLEALYAANPPAALNVAIPTRGVYAEAVQGNCTACERIDDSRYWRWTTEGMLAPPPIAQVTTDRPTPTEPNVTPTPLPAPLVSIQNAPELPNPTSMASILGLLAKPELFRDITGLAGTQANAARAFNSAMTNMTAIGNDAAALAKQQLALPNTQKMLDRLQGAVAADLLTPEQAQEFAEEAIRAAIGQPKQADKLPTEDPNVAKAVKAASESKKAEVKVTTPDETVEVKFEDKETKIGATPIPIVLPIDEMIKQDFIVEVMRGFLTTGTRTMIAVRLKKVSEVRGVTGAAPPESGTFPLDNVPEALVKRSGEDYEIRRRLQIVFPADATDPRKVAGTGRLPLVVLVHGQHAHWTPGSTANEPNHLGYTYLQSHLAQQGIISVSVDTNAANYINSYLEMRAEMVLEAIERVAKLDQTAASPLFGRVNLSNIGLMGHSRGGDAVVVAAKRDRSKGRTRIKAVCSLAPTDYTGTISLFGFNNSLRDYKETQLPDLFTEGPNTLTDPGLAYLVVYGGLDGDVHGLDGARGAGGNGFRHYDRARCSKAMVYLHLCSHNRFNTSWKGDTTGRDEGGVSPVDIGPFAGTPGRLLLPADHRRLANEYIGGFFRWRLLGDRAQGGLFNGTVANSARAEVSLQWSFSLDATPTDLKIRDIDDMEDPAASTIGARHINDGALGEFAAMDTSAVTPDPRTPDFRTLHQTSLYAANPNLPNASDVFRLEFLPVENWSAHKWLLLRVTADCDLTDLETIRLSELPKFFIQLSDNKGGSARLDETNFSPTPTRPVYHDVIQQGSVVSGTVLNLDTVRVPLTAFQGVDLSAITTFQILAGDLFPRHMFFDSIQVVKEN